MAADCGRRSFRYTATQRRQRSRLTLRIAAVARFATLRPAMSIAVAAADCGRRSFRYTVVRRANVTCGCGLRPSLVSLHFVADAPSTVCRAADCGRRSFRYTPRAPAVDRSTACCGLRPSLVSLHSMHRRRRCRLLLRIAAVARFATLCGACRTADAAAADCGRRSFRYTQAAAAATVHVAADCGRRSFRYTSDVCVQLDRPSLRIAAVARFATLG